MKTGIVSAQKQPTNQILIFGAEIRKSVASVSDYCLFIFCPKLKEETTQCRYKNIKAVLQIRELFVIELLFYVHGKQMRSCREGQLT